MIERWLDLVLRASGQDGVTAIAADLEADAALLCREGVPGACTYTSWGSPFSPAAARAALEPECDRGDAVSCLVYGWSLGQKPWGTGVQRAPHAVEARLAVERACELDLARGCVEAARALFHGVGSTARPNKARERLAPLCRGEEGSACAALGVVTVDPRKRRDLLAQAVDLGFAAAMRDLANMAGDDAIVLHDVACRTAVGASCRDLAALDAAHQRSALEQGCAVQHVGSCIDLAVLRFADGQQAEALASLDTLCERASEACARAQLLRLDTPPRTQLPGVLSERANVALHLGLEDGVWECYRARITRGDAFGTMALFVQIAPDGRIDGAAGTGSFVDLPLQHCLQAAARKVEPIPAPFGGPAMVQYDLFLAHAAEVRFRPDETMELDPDEMAMVEQLVGLSPQFEACAMMDPAEVAPIAVEVAIKRSGRVVVLGIPRSSEVADIDACAADVLRTARIVPIDFRVEGLVLVDFVQALRSREPEDR